MSSAAGACPQQHKVPLIADLTSYTVHHDAVHAQHMHNHVFDCDGDKHELQCCSCIMLCTAVWGPLLLLACCDVMLLIQADADRAARPAGG
jgi:hypothetical protein